MSESPESQEPLSKKDARAQAAAAKAYAKSQRPWFMRHKIMSGLGALILIIIIASAASSGGSGTKDTADTSAAAPASSAPASSAPASSAPASKPKTATIGTPVRDGKFEFTASSVKPGPNHVGGDGFGKDAQGQYWYVSVKVENIGDKPQSFFGSNQYMYVGKKKYGADDEAAMYLDNSKSLYEDINPGNSVSGTVIFDLPKGATPTSLDLHDSAFSGGVTIKI